MNPIIIIPARLNSTRLPEKPLAIIGGEPMIVHVLRRALETELGPVIVAVDHPSVAEAVKSSGGTPMLTRSDHPSGTDRIAEVLAVIDPERRHDIVINFQGDLPTVAPAIVRETTALLHFPEVAMATPVAIITSMLEAQSSSVVKMIGSPLSEKRFRALYFSRTQAPWGEGPLYHHIGLYVWRRKAFEQFVALPPSTLECREKLEQLRAIEAEIRVDAVLVDEVPLGVDTFEDLERARALLAPPARQQNVYV